MKRPTVTVHEDRTRRRGGRPAVISTSGRDLGQVHVMIDADEYDRAHLLAERERVTMPELLRRALRQFLERGGR